MKYEKNEFIDDRLLSLQKGKYDKINSNMKHSINLSNINTNNYESEINHSYRNNSEWNFRSLKKNIISLNNYNYEYIFPNDEAVEDSPHSFYTYGRYLAVGAGICSFLYAFNQYISLKEF